MDILQYSITMKSSHYSCVTTDRYPEHACDPLSPETTGRGFEKTFSERGVIFTVIQRTCKPQNGTLVLENFASTMYDIPNVKPMAIKVYQPQTIFYLNRLRITIFDVLAYNTTDDWSIWSNIFNCRGRRPPRRPIASKNRTMFSFFTAPMPKTSEMS